MDKTRARARIVVSVFAVVCWGVFLRKPHPWWEYLILAALTVLMFTDFRMSIRPPDEQGKKEN
jgi:hypothetical protein